MLSKHLANGHPRDMTLWINLGQTASDTAGFADALFRKIVVAYGHDLPRPLQERYVGWQDDPAISALVSQGDLRALLDKTAGELRRAGFRPLLVLENAAGGPFENLLAQQTAFPDAWIGVRSSAVESPERTMSVFRVEPESVESVAQYLEQLSGSGVTFSPAAVAALRDASGGNPHIVPRILEELPGWVFECSDQHIARAVGRLRMRGEFQLPPYPRVEGGIDWANHIAPVKGEERIREWSVYSRRIHALLPPGVQLTEIGALHLHEQTGGDWALTVQILRTLPADFRRLDLVPLLPVLEEILNPYL